MTSDDVTTAGPRSGTCEPKGYFDRVIGSGDDAGLSNKSAAKQMRPTIRIDMKKSHRTSSTLALLSSNEASSGSKGEDGVLPVLGCSA